MNAGRLAVLLLTISLASCTRPAERLPAARTPAPVPAEPTQLDLYVRAPDPDYSYQLVKTLEGPDYVASVLRMTSQRWRGPEEVDRTLWWHWLTVIRPETVTRNRALLFLAGGTNEDPEPEKVRPELAHIATATGSVVAELRMVPNQPLVFRGGSPSGPLREDALIAHAWSEFLRGGDDWWLPQLPMTKSAVRAMDAVTDFCRSAEGGNHPIDEYVVAGASKRGWTTWTTAAADRRVVAIIPLVIDLLNVENSYEHHYRVYGFWSEAIREYVEEGIPSWIGTERMHALRKIIDPYEYRSRLTMPKLMINGAGDEFFVPDSSRLYFDDLLGEKHIRYVPNAGHALRDTDAWQTVLAFYRSILSGTPRPSFTWELGANGSFEVRTAPRASPSQVLLWQASNPSARDFRVETLGKGWTSSAIAPRGDGSYAGKIETPSRGWTAFFIELTYPSEGAEPFKLTTEVQVVPDTLPFTFVPGN